MKQANLMPDNIQSVPSARAYGELVPPGELFAKIERDAKLGRDHLCFAQAYGALCEHYERAYRAATRKAGTP